MLRRAFNSAIMQTREFDQIFVVNDVLHTGAGPTRTRGMRAVETEWTAFLDDDDELLVNHHEVLVKAAIEHDADLVFPWFTVKGGSDPFPQFEGRVFNPKAPHMFPVTVLVKTEVIQATKGFPLAGPDGDDWPVWLELCEMGARIVHVPIRTWTWNHHGLNTSGKPDW